MPVGADGAGESNSVASLRFGKSSPTRFSLPLRVVCEWSYNVCGVQSAPKVPCGKHLGLFCKVHRYHWKPLTKLLLDRLIRNTFSHSPHAYHVTIKNGSLKLNKPVDFVCRGIAAVCVCGS